MLDCKVFKGKAALLGEKIQNVRIFKEYIFWDYDSGDNDCNGDDDDNDTSS